MIWAFTDSTQLSMKLLAPILLATLQALGSLYAGSASADSAIVHHQVIIWLKQAGDENIRQQYIDESKALSKLPGVLNYDIGRPVAIKRGRINPALDESYDLAISSRYESQQAYEAFLKNPEYLRIAQEVLKPLVDKYKIYDFVE